MVAAEQGSLLEIPKEFLDGVERDIIGYGREGLKVFQYCKNY